MDVGLWGSLPVQCTGSLHHSRRVVGIGRVGGFSKAEPVVFSSRAVATALASEMHSIPPGSPKKSLGCGAVPTGRRSPWGPSPRSSSHRPGEVCLLPPSLHSNSQGSQRRPSTPLFHTQSLLSPLSRAQRRHQATAGSRCVTGGGVSSW